MELYDYWSPKQIVACGKYPFTIGQLRHHLNFRHSNGLENCTRKVGKCILIRMDLFNEWIENQSAKKQRKD